MSEYIQDSEIEGSNKTAGRKKETMRRAVMDAWIAWTQTGELENLLAVMRKFIVNKTRKADKQLANAATWQGCEDFAQDVVLRFWKNGHLEKPFTPDNFYSYLNRSAHNALADASDAADKNKSRFVKALVTVENDGETEEVENNLLHKEPCGFHGLMFHPPIPFDEMTEEEKLVCAVCADNPLERILDGLVDRIIVHGGMEYYAFDPVGNYAEVAEQLTRWTGTTWNAKKVSNTVHRLNKRALAKQEKKHPEVVTYRDAWLAIKRRKRERMAELITAAALGPHRQQASAGEWEAAA